MSKNNGTPKKRKLTIEDDDFLFSEPIPRKEQKIFGIQSEYMVFYIAVIIVALIAAVVLFVTSLNFFGIGGSPAVTPVEPGINGAEVIIIPEPVEELAQFSAMITRMDQANRMFTFHDVNTRENRNLFASAATTLRGRHGQIKVFNEFAPGDIVEVAYNPEGTAINSMQIAEASWSRLASGLAINLDTDTIIANDEILTFNTNLMILNNNEAYSIENIGPLTTVTMRGIGNTVWYMNVERGSALVRVVGGGDIINGFVEISREASLPVGAGVNPLDQEAQVSEGTHRIVVHGDNIALSTWEVNILGPGVTEISLADIPIISGHLRITTNVEAIVTINGMQVDISQPLPLNFNTYRIMAQREGYQAFDENVVFDTHNQELNIMLVAEPQTLPAGLSARVEIRSEPAGALVFIDNVFVGTAPVVTQVEHGIREVSLQMDGFTTTVHNIFVGSQPMLPFTYEMQPLPSLPQPDPEPITPVLPPVIPEQPEVLPPPGTPYTNNDDLDLTFVPGD